MKLGGGKGFFVRARDMDVVSGIRHFDLDALEEAAPERKKSVANLPKRFFRGLF